MVVIELVRTLRYYIPPLYLFKGKEKTSGSSLKIAYLGWDKRISSYLMERLMRVNYSSLKMQKISVWNVYNYFTRKKKIVIW